MPDRPIRYVSRKTIAERLEVSEKTLQRMVSAGDFPPPGAVVGAGHPRWLESVVDAWMILNNKPGSVEIPSSKK